MKKWMIVLSVAFLLIGCQKQATEEKQENKESAFDWNKQYLGLDAMDVSEENYVELYQEAYEEGLELGYTPILVEVSETLEESVGFSKEEYGSYQKMHKALKKEAAKLKMEDYFEQEASKDTYFDLWVKSDSRVNSYEAYTEITLLSDSIYLVKMDTKNPYDVFAYIPMGGYNDCLSNPQLIATFQLWYEQFGIVPVSIGYDNVQVTFSKELDKKQREQFGKQLYFVNKAILDFGYETLEDVMKGVEHSACWMLWWD